MIYLDMLAGKPLDEFLGSTPRNAMWRGSSRIACTCRSRTFSVVVARDERTRVLWHSTACKSYFECAALDVFFRASIVKALKNNATAAIETGFYKSAQSLVDRI